MNEASHLFDSRAVSPFVQGSAASDALPTASPDNAGRRRNSPTGSFRQMTSRVRGERAGTRVGRCVTAHSLARLTTPSLASLPVIWPVLILSPQEHSLQLELLRHLLLLRAARVSGKRERSPNARIEPRLLPSYEKGFADATFLHPPPRSSFHTPLHLGPLPHSLYPGPPPHPLHPGPPSTPPSTKDFPPLPLSFHPGPHPHTRPPRPFSPIPSSIGHPACIPLCFQHPPPSYPLYLSPSFYLDHEPVTPHHNYNSPTTIPSPPHSYSAATTLLLHHNHSSPNTTPTLLPQPQLPHHSPYSPTSIPTLPPQFPTTTSISPIQQQLPLITHSPTTTTTPHQNPIPPTQSQLPHHNPSSLITIPNPPTTAPLSPTFTHFTHHSFRFLTDFSLFSPSYLHPPRPLPHYLTPDATPVFP
ncbi:hypothetical protein C7M84_009227 [Penaeus vannamei]|uniref:Uncharacterized protein n=1 Tax=Penaeus vannamei TaxID=6689 RepID=A0A423T7H5_PENVA|nr:hypothetical protein C7M84_009227 [Penaeus vannamei]